MVGCKLCLPVLLTTVTEYFESDKQNYASKLAKTIFKETKRNENYIDLFL
jgi:hypothetical protein